MPDDLPLILQIQRDCLDHGVPLAQVLRKAKVAASKLGNNEFLNWINLELEGYHCEAKDLPSYRILRGTPKGYNPYHGWRDIAFQSSDTEEILSTAPINQAIGPLEETLKNMPADQTLIFPYPPEVRSMITRAIRAKTEVHLELPISGAFGLIEAVRNTLLNWTLDMEKENILGEGMTFGPRERETAKQVTQNFYVNNIAFAGHADDHAHVFANQVNYQQTIDVKEVENLLKKIKDSLHLLPISAQSEAQKLTLQIESEMSNESNSHSKIRSLLNSMKTVCESALGNLTAEGIIAVIDKLVRS